MKTFLQTYKTEIICALAGAFLAVILGMFVMYEMKTPAGSSLAPELTATQTEPEEEQTPVLSDSYDDMTDLVGYCLYGTHVVYDADGVKLGSMTFGEDQSFTGYLDRATGTISDGTYAVTMTETGETNVIISRGRDQDTVYTMTYDEEYRPVLTGADGSLVLEFQIE